MLKRYGIDVTTFVASTVGALVTARGVTGRANYSSELSARLNGIIE